MTKDSLFPVPKVLLPFIGGCFAILAQVVATGEFDRVELGQLVLLLGVALFGWSTPKEYEDVPVVGKTIEARKA